MAIGLAALLAGCASMVHPPSDFCDRLSADALRLADPDQARTAAQRFAVYAAMANDAYMRFHTHDWSAEALIPIPPEWQDFCEPDEVVPPALRTNFRTAWDNVDICQAENLQYGFEAKVYLRRPQRDRPPTEIVLVFRGTTSALDWWFGNVLDVQYVLADLYTRSTLRVINARYPGMLTGEGSPVSIVATGHSLGSGLAEHIAHCYSHLGVRAVSFNTTPRVHHRTCATGANQITPGRAASSLTTSPSKSTRRSRARASRASISTTRS